MLQLSLNGGAAPQGSACALETQADRRVAETHLISLPHVAVEDPSHALDRRMLQLMGPAHIVIDAPGEQRQRDRMMHQDGKGELHISIGDGWNDLGGLLLDAPCQGHCALITANDDTAGEKAAGVLNLTTRRRINHTVF